MEKALNIKAMTKTLSIARLFSMAKPVRYSRPRSSPSRHQTKPPNASAMAMYMADRDRLSRTPISWSLRFSTPRSSTSKASTTPMNPTHIQIGWPSHSAVIVSLIPVAARPERPAPGNQRDQVPGVAGPGERPQVSDRLPPRPRRPVCAPARTTGR